MAKKKKAKPKTEASGPKVDIHCDFCSEVRQVNPKNDGEGRLPNGWKHELAGKIMCGACMKKHYDLRAVEFHVLKPVNKDWKEFNDTCRTLWGETTRLWNYYINQFYLRDYQRLPGAEKLPSWEMPYLYPETKGKFNLPSSTRASCERAAKGKYKAKRFDLVWVRNCGVPSHRYPVPFTLPNKLWKVRLDKDGNAIVTMMLPGDHTEVQLALAGRTASRNRSMAVSISRLKQLAAGLAIKGELALNRDEGSGKMEEKPSGGRNTKKYTPKIKLVGYFPRETNGAVKKPKSKVLLVNTSNDCFLYAVVEDRKRPWVVNADHMQRHYEEMRRKNRVLWRLHNDRVAIIDAEQMRKENTEHLNGLQRLSEDAKAEYRMPSKRRKKFWQKQQRPSKRYHRKMRHFCHAVSTQLVNFAQRNRVTTIKYNDTEKGYLSTFPWADLKTMVKDKAKGVEFVHVNSKEEKKKKAEADAAEE